MADLLTAKALREKRAPLGKQILQMRDKAAAENREFNSEELPTWETVNKEYDGLTIQIQMAERAEKVSADANEPAGNPEIGRENRGKVEAEKAAAGQTPENPDPVIERSARSTEEQRALALQAWFLTGRGLELSKRHLEAVQACREDRSCFADRSKGEFVINLRSDYRQVRNEARALSAFNQTAGAYTIPEGFVNNLEVALLQFNGPRQVASVFRTESGNDLPWPTVNDTTNKGSIIAENTAVSTKDVVFGQIVFHAYKYTSGLVLVPVELMEDSAFQLGAELGSLLGTRLGRIQADHFTTGTGASQPTGIVTAATSGVTAASTSAIAADEIYGLKHSVDPAYRMNAGWMMHDQILLVIKKLKDGQGRYIWQAGLADKAPDTLDGDPIAINQSMDSTMASGKKTLLYGDFSKYKIRDVAELRMKRLVERYADADQEGFLAFLRCDGNLLDAATHPVKYLTH